MKPPVCRLFRHVISWVALLILFSACGIPRETPHGLPPMRAITDSLYPLSPEAYPIFDDDMGCDGMVHAIMQSLAYLEKIPDTRSFRFGKDIYSKSHMVRSLQFFSAFLDKNPSGRELDKFVRSNYLVYRSVGDRETGRVLFTGYYEPFLNGSSEPSERYPHPVYSLPDDLVFVDLPLFAERFKAEGKLIGRMKSAREVGPYFSREEIHRIPSFQDRAAPLAWVNDPIDLFFLEIQGSGKIYLDDGRVLNVHYQASNGHPYRSIGALLIRQEKIGREEMSMQSIKAYLRAHPDEMDGIFAHNPSQVFFQVEPDGPLGCLGVKLTPGRSIALQRSLFPDAALAFIETSKPLMDGDGNIQSWDPLRRFALFHDTGGAIQGAGRADLFWGNGDYAEIAAGHMRHVGDLYFLVLKSGEQASDNP